VRKQNHASNPTPPHLHLRPPPRRYDGGNRKDVHRSVLHVGTILQNTIERDSRRSCLGSLLASRLLGRSSGGTTRLVRVHLVGGADLVLIGLLDVRLGNG
jgi:hypothetical protein